MCIRDRDILELDRYCLDRGIELVPSLSTFGHLYKILGSKPVSYTHLFLYNTLESIRARALVLKDRETAEAIEGLGRLYRTLILSLIHI